MLKRAVAGTLAGAALVVAGIAGSASPAQAYITGCTGWYSTMGATAYCSGGTSTNFKVAVLCENRFTWASRVQYGNAVRVGGGLYSSTGCNWYENYYGTPWAVSA